MTAPIATAVGNQFPSVQSLTLHSRQDLVDIAVAGLSYSMMIDQRSEGVEVDAKPTNQTKQSRLHDRRPMGDPVFRAHLHDRFHQAQSDMRYDAAIEGGGRRVLLK